MLSICIPNYNTEVTALISELRKQLVHLSVVFEILVLDDASTYPISINSFPQLRLSRNQKNCGRHASRKILASKASYENILFLDADVMPSSSTYIKTYLNHCNREYDIVYGGVSYQQNKPEGKMMLRWKYGRYRESVKMVERKKEKYQNLISMAFMVKKRIFSSLEIEEQYTGYGQDILISYLINKNNYTITHIENPVVHLGLEENEKYLQKVHEGLKFTWLLESKNMIPEDFRPVQRAALKLEKFHLSNIFCFLVSFLEKPIQDNLISSNPSMILLDLNKLYFYTSLKKSI